MLKFVKILCSLVIQLILYRVYSRPINIEPKYLVLYISINRTSYIQTSLLLIKKQLIKIIKRAYKTSVLTYPSINKLFYRGVNKELIS